MKLKDAPQVQAHLAAMMKADQSLYERVMDTTGFAYHFNELVKLAIEGEVSLKTKTPEHRAPSPF